MAVKYYAVRKGIKPGIYKDWNTCKAMVTGFSGAQYKSFTTLQEAEAYIKEDAETAQAGKEPEVYAFVDGSFNQKTHVYGYGGSIAGFRQRCGHGFHEECGRRGAWQYGGD